jgi:hypothetical protein
MPEGALENSQIKLHCSIKRHQSGAGQFLEGSYQRLGQNKMQFFCLSYKSG